MRPAWAPRQYTRPQDAHRVADLHRLTERQRRAHLGRDEQRDLIGASFERVGGGRGRNFASPRFIVRVWMRRPIHRHAILSSRFSSMGVGAVRGTPGGGRRGGSLLVVPHGSDAWRESIVHPIPYPVVPPYGELAKLMRHDPAEDTVRPWQDAVRRTVDAIAGLTAVDGAAVISDQFYLLAFGAKIGRADGSMPVEKVVVTEPVVGSDATELHPTQIGGTRHLSAAQFVHDQPDALALVASQGGRFTAFAWSPCEGMVHAHRVETLLL
ncbi:MAG: hypothetical protein KY464_16165 [Gemmatimonadetes bacterium]|nr:hypothetical protein [Gemmatimonadota bacterium]